MSAANATAQFSKSDKNAITAWRDPNSRSARLKSAKLELKFYAIGTLILFLIAQILILVALYGQLYQDLTAFLWATPSAMMFLSLCMLGVIQSSKAYADVQAIYVYESLAQAGTDSGVQ